jgi:hypothetical protein
MAIREFSSDGSPRQKIGLVGLMPQEGELKRFRERKFLCESLTPEYLRGSEDIAQLDAVIWTPDSRKPSALLSALKMTVPRLLDHDVRVYLRIVTDEKLGDTPRKLVVNSLLEIGMPVANLLPEEWRAIPEVRRERQNNFLSPCVYVFDAASDWVDIATMVCDRAAGPSSKSGQIFDEDLLRHCLGSDGHDERVILLKRSFWNCSELRLAPLDGGMSGAPVFKAYASLDAGLVPSGKSGAYPKLHFIKLGPRKKIVDEYDKYCSQIFEYVPFYLGPRLRRDRCNLGSTQGVLVGDFVEGAEPLVACARGGRCGHAISNLFEKTLGGWRKQARRDTTGLLSDYLEKKWHTEDSDALIALPVSRAEIVRGFGCDTAVEPLKGIFDKLGKTKALLAPAHGDMHAMNVLVRHGDAILIDFEKLEEHYPLTYDPASLEGGLLVEGFIEDLKNKRLTPDALKTQISPLYDPEALKKCQATFCRPGDATEWYYDAVNQIRTLTWSAENAPDQYALTLALCLVRKGCNTHPALEAEEPNTLRALAFFFGQNILRAIAPSTGAAARARRNESKPPTV